MSEEKRLKVLVVDDDKSVRDFLSHFLKMHKMDAVLVEDGFEAIELAKKEKFDLALLDIRMPRINGLRVFAELKKVDLDIACIFMTGYAIEATLLDSTLSPGNVVLRKPFENISHIKETIDKVIQGMRVIKDSGQPRDRRAFIRMDIILEIEYKIHQSQGPFVHSTAKDVGPSGIKLLINEKLPVGAGLDIILRAPRGGAECATSGKVIWIDASKEVPGCYQAGVEITEVDFSELAKLLFDLGRISSKKLNE